MNLTGKAKEDFEKWWNMKPKEERLIFSKIDDDYNFDWSVEKFFSLPISMQIGVIIDWFDSVGIYIQRDIKGYCFEVWDYRVSEPSTPKFIAFFNDYEELPEARTKVFEKANELYN